MANEDIGVPKHITPDGERPQYRIDADAPWEDHTPPGADDEVLAAGSGGTRRIVPGAKAKVIRPRAGANEQVRAVRSLGLQSGDALGDNGTVVRGRDPRGDGG